MMFKKIPGIGTGNKVHDEYTINEFIFKLSLTVSGKKFSEAIGSRIFKKGQIVCRLFYGDYWPRHHL